MSKGPKDDPTSLGNILLKWEVITKAELDQALQDQRLLRGDDLLGRLLIANGSCTEEEITAATAAQASMRDVSKHKCAMAVADLALERRRRQSVVARRESLIRRGEAVVKSITGDQHPAITSAMLAKPENS